MENGDPRANLDGGGFVSDATVRIDTRRLHALRGALDGRAQQLIDKAAFDVEEGAKERAPVLTGFLKNSIATEIHPLKDIVKVGAEYGIFQEMGTRSMRAHPFLIPALEAVRPKFVAAWKQLIK